MLHDDKINIYGLIGVPLCGSHFLLHKLNEHKSILALSENSNFHLELKKFFEKDHDPYLMLREFQVLNRKKITSEIKYCFINKKPLQYLSYYFPMFRNRISFLYCFRNPVSLAYSWLRDWIELKERRGFEGKISLEETTNFVFYSVLSSVFEFSRYFDPRKGDFFVNVDSLIFNENVLNNAFDIMQLKKNDIEHFEKCDLCGTKFEKRKTLIKGREEEALWCCKCNKFAIGAGDFNPIRSISEKGLRSWKENDQSAEIFLKACSIFGEDIMKYFAEELYLNDSEGEIFSERFQELMRKMGAPNV